MSRHFSQAVMLGVALFVMSHSADAQQLATAFTYQGHMRLSGDTFNGTADFQFAIWTAEEDGFQLQPVLFFDDLAVVDGLITVELDFGAITFPGDARWLEIGVREAGENGNYTFLEPRQPLTATPYAIQTRGMFVNNEGDRVGLGTFQPDTDLHVHARSDDNVVVKVDSGLTGIHHSAVEFADRGNSIWSIGKDSVNNFFLDQNFAGRLITINNLGNIGIGTSSPAVDFHVAGPAIFDTASFGAGDDGYHIRAVMPDDPWADGIIDFGGVGIGSFTGGNHQMTMFTDGAGGQSIFTVANSTNAGQDWNARLTVQQNGNVGIGTSDPAQNLHVAGTARVDALQFADNSVQTRAFIGVSAQNIQVNFGLIAPGIRAVAVATLSGAAPGDLTIVNTHGDSEDVPGGLFVTSRVPEANQIRIELTNFNAVAIDPPLLVFNVMAIRP